MTYRDLLKQLNYGMLIKGFKIESSGTEAEIEARKQLLDNYTGTFTYNNLLIGVKPISDQQPDMIGLHWQFCTLEKREANYFNMGLYFDDALISKFSFTMDSDVDAVLADLGFTKFVRGA